MTDKNRAIPSGRAVVNGAGQAVSAVPIAVTHIRNGRVALIPRVHGGGETWCGKKLVGKPEAADGESETFSSYGNVLHVSMDPAEGTCPYCRTAFDAAYAKAFPEGLKPIATFRADNPADLARAKALLGPDAMNSYFGPGGGGLTAFHAALCAQGIEAQSATTEGRGPQDESPVADRPCAHPEHPTVSDDDRRRG